MRGDLQCPERGVVAASLLKHLSLAQVVDAARENQTAGESEVIALAGDVLGLSASPRYLPAYSIIRQSWPKIVSRLRMLEQNRWSNH